MELDLSALGVPETLTVDQRFDGTSGWTLSPMQGDTEITDNQLENMRNNTFPNSLLTYKEMGTTVELQPGEQLGGKDMIILLVTPKTGSATKVFLDATTYLVRRTVTTIDAPELGGLVEQVGDYSDYRAVDGVQMAFAVVNTNPAQTLTIRLSDVVHNIPLDDALFKGR
jgi:outer membrane lipoprotein-sorting protein